MSLDLFDIMALVSFIAVLYCCFYLCRVRALEKKVGKLAYKMKGEDMMSKVITMLVGKRCKLKSKSGFPFTGNAELSCEVLEADEEWIKITYEDKRKGDIIKIIRIENIDHIDEVSE